MKKKPYRWKPKRVLRLPDLDHAKTAVLNTLGSPDSRLSYRFAIDDPRARRRAVFESYLDLWSGSALPH